MAECSPNSHYNGFEKSIPLRDPGCNIGPFRATQIWNEIICHLKSRVEIKRRRHKMRSYDNCFTGTDAVDVVLHYLLNDQETFNTELSREKAIKLCQALMNKNVFESVSCRPGDGKQVFEDSNSKLFRFPGSLEECKEDKESDEELNESEMSMFDHVEEAEYIKNAKPLRVNPAFEPDVSSDSMICNPAKIGRSGSVMEELMKISSTIKCKSATSLEPRRSDAKNTRTSDNQDISLEVVEETWKEVALAQLLMLVDVPFLDGVLCDEKENKKQLRRNLIISNVVAKHTNMPFLSGVELEDSVKHTAYDCLECMPKGMSILSDESIKQSDAQMKTKFFWKIAKYYTELADPLLPERFIDLHLAILNLIMTQRDKTALEALQLDVILLPWSVREELQRLVRFLSAVSSDKTFSLDVQDSNKTIVLKVFCDSILKHKLLRSNVAAEFIQFLLTHIREIFNVPRNIREKVSLRLYKLKHGDCMPMYESTYCNRISKEEYQRQSEECTQSSLIEMINSVLDDVNTPLKDKKLRLRQFQKCYPNIYERYFQGMI